MFIQGWGLATGRHDGLTHTQRFSAEYYELLQMGFALNTTIFELKNPVQRSRKLDRFAAAFKLGLIWKCGLRKIYCWISRILPHSTKGLTPSKLQVVMKPLRVNEIRYCIHDKIDFIDEKISVTNCMTDQSCPMTTGTLTWKWSHS